MTISDASHFDAVRTGLETIAAIRSLHPERFAWVNNEDGYWIDSLLGTDRIRLAMNAGESIEISDRKFSYDPNYYATIF